MYDHINHIVKRVTVGCCFMAVMALSCNYSVEAYPAPGSCDLVISIPVTAPIASHDRANRNMFSTGSMEAALSSGTVGGIDDVHAATSEGSNENAARLTPVLGNEVNSSSIPPVQKTVVIPYRPVGLDLFAVHAFLGKHTEGDFIMDTGSAANFISDRFAAKLKLPTQPLLIDGKVVSYNGQPGRFITVPSVRIGGLVITNMAFTVLNLGTISGVIQIDGIISGKDLTPCTALFDPPALQIKLWYPAGVTNALLKGEGFDPTAFVPIEKYHGEFPYATHVMFQNGSDKGSEEMIIDTGADATQISSALAASLNLVPYEKKKYVTLFSDPVEESMAYIQTLTFGDQIASESYVHYTSTVIPNMIESKLGMDVLGKYRMLFDFAGGKLYLNPRTVAQLNPTKVIPQGSPMLISPPAPTPSSP